MTTMTHIKLTRYGALAFAEGFVSHAASKPWCPNKYAMNAKGQEIEAHAQQIAFARIRKLFWQVAFDEFSGGIERRKGTPTRGNVFLELLQIH